MEVWKSINGYCGLYEVSNLGNVKSLNFSNGKVPKVLKPQKDKNGYLVVNLYNNGKVRNFKIHRLVAQAFLNNEDNLPQINHINEIKNDNRVENLEWCTNKYNVNYGSHSLKQSLVHIGKKHTQEHIQKIRDGSINKKAVEMIDINTKEVIQIFQSASEAAREVNGVSTNVSKICRENKGTYKGYFWRYI